MNTGNEHQQIMDILEQIVTMLKKMSEKKDILHSDELLDNGDICVLLGITKRTLQRYRQHGVLPYHMVKGKTYYKAGEVQERLKRIMKGNNNNEKFK